MEKQLIFRWLRSPIFIMLSIIAGGMLGLLNKEYSLMLAPMGAIYLKLLKMTVLPILITAVITSLGNLFSQKDVKSYLGKILLIFMISLVFCAVLSLLVSVIAKPGVGLSKVAQVTLGKVLSEADQQGSQIVLEHQGIYMFLEQLIPENIFQAMNEGASLEILFFCLILGMATGIQPVNRRETILELSDALFRSLFTIIDWIMYFLPFGLFSLLAGQIAKSGIETLLSMVKFVCVVWGTSLLMVAVSAIVIMFSTQTSITKSFGALKESMLVAFGTQSTFASMPAAIEGLIDGLGVDRKLVNLVIPLGTVINRFSMIILYTTATIFTAQLYGITFSFPDILTILILSILAAIAGAGTPGIVSLSMIAMIFIPLELPSEAIIVLLLAINPVIEPITTLSNIYTNCAVTALIAKLTKRSTSREIYHEPTEGEM